MIKNKYLREMVKQFEKKYHIKWDDIPKWGILDEEKIKDSWREALYIFFTILNYQEFLIELNKDNFMYVKDFKYSKEVNNDNSGS